MLEALGLIEVVGLVGAIEAADTASKAADVKVIGYELTRGSGMVVVKMVGGVSAVKSAVEAASVAAEKITQIISKHVIARPSDELDKIINAEKEKSDKKFEEVVVDYLLFHLLQIAQVVSYLSFYLAYNLSQKVFLGLFGKDVCVCLKLL